jgi:hypothetical protein
MSSKVLSSSDGRSATPDVDLSVRAPYELPISTPLVVDCGPVGGFRYQNALLFLSQAGFNAYGGASNSPDALFAAESIPAALRHIFEL